jgi:N-acetylglucosaminyldiphosphoundecaprenol N-acetyl-beta-D-mannosaminyltransferase
MEHAMSLVEPPLPSAATDVSVGAPFPLDRRRTPRVQIGGLSIDTRSRSELLTDVLQHALSASKTRQIVTANAQFYVLADRDTRFRACLERSEYCCADGMPIVWACKTLAGVQVPRIAGVDFIEDICRAGSARRLRVYLLGGVPGAATAAASVLATRYPGIEIVGTDCPPYHFEKQPETLRPVLERITAAKPHVLFVALGAPKQEYFIDEQIRPLQVPIAIGIGGSFEIICGKLSRAPRWMQRAGLEWLFRLRQEPRRLWKRYLIGNVEFVLCLLRGKTAGPGAANATSAQSLRG